jgi:hypothetical protein
MRPRPDTIEQAHGEAIVMGDGRRRGEAFLAKATHWWKL